MSDVPADDAQEQSRSVQESMPAELPDRGLEVPEADALEQAAPVPESADDDRY